MNSDSRLLSVVAISGSSILVGCGGYSGSSCGSYGSYGSYGSFGVGAVRRRVRNANGARAANAPAATSMSRNYPACASPGNVAAGIYAGTLTDGITHQVDPVVVIIAENGDGVLSGQDGVYYRLSVSTWDNSASGSFYAYSQAADSNGVQSDFGTVAATVTPAGLSGTLTHRSGEVGSLSLTFDDTYYLASSLPTLAGSWSSSVNGFGLTATIASDGTFTAVDSDNCSYSGSFSPIDPNVNAYSESFARSCNGSTTTFTGLASYFPATASGTPTRIRVFADDNRGDYLVADLQ